MFQNDLIQLLQDKDYNFSYCVGFKKVGIEILKKFIMKLVYTKYEEILNLDNQLVADKLNR